MPAVAHEQAASMHLPLSLLTLMLLGSWQRSLGLRTVLRTRHAAAPLRPALRLYEARGGDAGGAPRAWDLRGLKQEASRQLLRGVKKGEKLRARLRKSQTGFGEDADALQAEIEALNERQGLLSQLDQGLQGVKSVGDEGFGALEKLAVELGVGDSPPERVRGPKKKKKAVAHAPRMPYWTYTAEGGFEVRVGRTAADNDKLSCDPEHRSSRDWWLHVAGFPGSHVVIRCEDDDLPESNPRLLKDAALLCAKYSKAPQGGNIPVTFTRCRHVSKPPGAKPGLVQVSDRAGTVNVRLGNEAQRVRDLEDTRFPPRQD